MPVIGAPLAGLVALWAAGRMAMILEYWIGPAAGVVDSAFLVVFALVVWREVIAGRNWRNLPVCALVTVFALANVAFHLRAHFAYSEAGVRLGIAAIAMLLTLIGGRITPSFTRNWLKSRGELAEPAPAGVVDRVVLGLTGTATAAWVIAPEGHGAGVLLVLAGLANLVRLIRWRGWLAAREPLLWILHVGYAFLGVALILLGSAVLSDLIPRTAGLHALTAGAVGVMTLAVMTRATRGHTGRTLAADKLTALVYGAILVAAAARVSAPFLPGVEMQLLIASAFAWFVAYAGFATAYAPMLLRPRPDRA
jgi:uncharacterized protein involved in response to NO